MPRPHEWVTRAWHSDRHQPMRGSLIQEIFRVANEIHSSTAKKNKEWQEKLPIVVLKAEEIMYSKANSEAEYMDLKTLCDRTIDAINTIIRQDASTETGEFLQPCIEAALNLGCTSRKASRRQRNNNPRCYLSANGEEPTCVPPNNVDKKTQRNHTTNFPFVCQNLNATKPTNMNLTLLGSQSHSSIPQKNNHTTNKFPLLCWNFPLCDNIVPLTTEPFVSSNPCSASPLYYGNQIQSKKSRFSFHLSPSLNLENAKPAETSHTENLFHCALGASNKTSRANLRDNTKNPTAVSVPSMISIERHQPKEVEDVGSRTSREGSKLNNLTPQTGGKEFTAFPSDNPLDYCPEKWRTESETMNVETQKRKRKAVSYLSEDTQICWQPNLVCNHLIWKFEQCRLVD